MILCTRLYISACATAYHACATSTTCFSPLPSTTATFRLRMDARTGWGSVKSSSSSSLRERRRSANFEGIQGERRNNAQCSPLSLDGEEPDHAAFEDIPDDVDDVVLAEDQSLDDGDDMEKKRTFHLIRSSAMGPAYVLTKLAQDTARE